MPRIAVLTLLATFVVTACTSAPAPTSAPSLLPAASLVPSPAAAVTAAPATAGPGRPIDASLFSRKGGCGDVFLWAATEDGTSAVTVEWTGGASQAWDNARFDEAATLPDVRITVTLVTGRQLSTYYCNDLIQAGQGTDREIPAVAGTATLVVEPNRDGMKPAALAALTLESVNFDVIVGGEPEVWHLDGLEWRDVLVGWLAG
jgi:hypothetical protein